MPAEPFAFLSYAHQDDDHPEGAVSEFCRELSGAMLPAIGGGFSIYQDRKNNDWGDHWPTKLNQNLLGSCVLITILSPSYFNSRHCRKELPALC